MKRFVLLLIGLIIIFGLSTSIFYFNFSRSPKTEEVEHPLRNPISKDEIHITFSNPGRTKEILRTVVLNKLIVEDSSLDVTEVSGEKKALLNLKTSFTYHGRERELIIPIVDTISFSKKIDEDFKDQGEKNVISLELRKGDMVNIALSYVPKEVAIEKEVVASFCNARVYGICLRYLKLGFGNSPIDFKEYLDKTLEANQRIDYQIAFPTSLFLLEK